jgi:signal transduction histidine kinase
MLGGESGVSEPSLFDWLDPNAGATMRDNLNAALLGEVRSFEVPSRRGGGGRGTSSVLYAPVWEGTRVSKVLALVRDVTDQRRTEAQLQQAEKLAAIGQLVSGVAHEINNPAAIISGFAQTMLLDDLKAEHRDMAKTIHDEATRIGRITQNLLAFARAGGKERALIDLNDTIRRTFALRSYHLSTLNIAVTLDLDASDPRIWANASEVQQLLLNIVINAEQALVTIDPPRTITIRSSAAEHDVRLEIADNGPGIPEDIRARVFDPFFTTKPEGVGTGLGLSICYGIARDHGGRISLESERGQGAKFVVELPRDPRTTPRPPSDTRLPGGTPARRVSVLLVDDEASLRTALLQFLTRRGLDATGVGDGAEALRVLKARPFDVIVSDVRMPGMGGRAFIEQLKLERPELVPRVIFSTGDAFERETASLLQESGAPTVSKPFDFSTLERLIRDLAMRTKVA